MSAAARLAVIAAAAIVLTSTAAPGDAAKVCAEAPADSARAPPPVWPPATTTSTTTTATAGSANGCGRVRRCLEHPSCAACLAVVNATDDLRSHAEFESLSPARSRVVDEAFFAALQANAACSVTSTPPALLQPALHDLGWVGGCSAVVHMVTTKCFLLEYECFADAGCRACLEAVYARNRTRDYDVLRSPACSAPSTRALLDEIGNFCFSFPTCTYTKVLCDDTEGCPQCWGMLRAGDPAGAARRCPSGSAGGHILASLVDLCLRSSEIGCGFWRERCALNGDCSACMGVIGGSDALAPIVSALGSGSCQRSMQAAEGEAFEIMGHVVAMCPSVPQCQKVVLNCVSITGPKCAACVNGSLPPDECQLTREYGVDAGCGACPESVRTITRLSLATAAIGGASAILCALVALTIVARGRDRSSMRDRIVVGLMVANMVFSVANTVPVNALHTDEQACGQLALSFDAIRAGRALWFCGKYALVSCELAILGASIHALLSGDSSGLRPGVELTMHCACFAAGTAAFAVFFWRCAATNADGYNRAAEVEARTGAFDFAGLSDDLDDDQAGARASARFQHGRDEYDALMREMLLGWNALLGLAVALWVALRLMYARALRALRRDAAALARAESEDRWADTRRSTWEAWRHAHEEQRAAFGEVARPLEAYIGVFVAFAAPAVLMSTTWCASRSGAAVDDVQTDMVVTYSAASTISYGACDAWCEFALAFRSACAAAVFLLPAERRAELADVRTTWRMLVGHVTACVCCCSWQRRRRRRRFSRMDSGIPGMIINSGDDDGDGGDDDGGGHDGNSTPRALVHMASSRGHSAAAAAAEPAEAPLQAHRIREADIVLDNLLDRGGFGDVWAGRLQPGNRSVAIKVLFSGAVDEEGDPIDPEADEDFKRECDALSRVRNLHCVRFWGYGVSSNGSGFIVTELMLGGSLKMALRGDEECDLPWRTRVSIALQVALGMEHLHSVHMLHRDLKSANVLLDEEFKVAKVCDFGLARVARPAPPRVLQSKFTGFARRLPAAGLPRPAADASPPVAAAHGDMTKAAGTLLWMAPEVFRGDCDYTKSVDVYSFGIVCWEIATRQAPWSELTDDGIDDMRFYGDLTRALQTGRRPTVPPEVESDHAGFVSVLRQCWAGDAANRPSFAQAASALAACLRAELESVSR